MKDLLYRSILRMFALVALLFGLLLLYILVTAWESSSRLGPLVDHGEFWTDLHGAYGRLGAALVPDQRPPQADLSAAARELVRLVDRGEALGARTPADLRRAARLLTGDGAGEGANPDAAMKLLGAALLEEAGQRRALLGDLERSSRGQWLAAMVLAVLLSILVVVLGVLFHRRVLKPLEQLQGAISLLARKDYRPVELDRADPLVGPLVENFNRMVKRMRDLEQGHLKREGALRNDVDQATRALVEQQAAMARKERMAAIGEFSARLSHELRNPLSGVLMALSNLRHDIESEDQDERLRLAIQELERISSLLTNVVDESRQTPERPQRVALEPVLEGLARLVRYQLPDNVDLRVEAAPDLYCHLPEGAFRYAVLNLVVNAAQALDPGPGRIVIAAQPAAQESMVEVSVEDDGPGFPDELLRVGAHEYGSWRRGGTGIGLAMVRRFAQAQGGRLELENPGPAGARARLLLPLDDKASG